MDFLELAKRRYSLRKYSRQDVPHDVLERCLEAARLAPSACNSQPWKFLVVRDDALRRKLAGKAFSGAYRMNAFAVEAPALVFVVCERSRYAARLGGLLRGVRYSLIDIGIACEHLVLQAAQEGVGSCWLGWFNERAVKRMLGLPRRAHVPIVISLGYAGDTEIPRKNRKPFSEIVEYRQSGT